MLGCIVKLNLFSNTPGFIRGKCFIQRSWLMSIKIVANKHNLCRISKMHIH